MIGTKFFKSSGIDWDAYATCAQWANKNGAIIVERDDCYECVAVEMPVKSLDNLKTEKTAGLEASFDTYVSGAFKCSLGFDMQFNRSDSLAVQGAVMLLETQESGATGYLTDAENVTHYNISLSDMKAVLLEMLSAYASAHAKKQQYRAAINSAESEADLDVIEFEWSESE